jgi:tetratricopeptide (TPR) repeat protein
MSRSPAYLVFAFFLVLSALPAGAADSGCDQAVETARRIEACTAILERNDQTPLDRFTAYVNRAHAYDERQLSSQAIADYASAIELAKDPAIPNGSRAMAYTNRGVIFYNVGEYSRALADFNHAVEFGPNDPVPYLDRGQVSYLKGDTSGAIADYGRVLELDPNFGAAYFNRGLTYAKEGNHIKAIADYTRLIELNPEDAEAYLNRGISYFAMADFDKASAEFARAVSLSKNPHFPIWRYLAETRRGQKAAPELEANAKRLWSRLWPYPAIELYLGKRDFDSAYAAAMGHTQQCEANFYFAEWAILQSRPGDAEAMLQKAADICAKDVPQYKMSAQAELKRLRH